MSYVSPNQETYRLPGLGEQAFTILILLMSTAAFSCLTTTPGETAGEPGIMGKLVAGSIYLTTIILLVRHCDFWKTMWAGRWVIALASLAVLSTIWSDDPSSSFRKGISVGATALFGFYFACRYPIHQQIRLLARMCGISMICSLVFGLLELGHSVDTVPGWFGIYEQKNVLGKVAVLSVLVFWYLARIDARARWAARAGILLALVLIYLSNSMTAMMVFPLLVGVQLLLRGFRRSFWLGTALLGLSSILGVVALRWVMTHAQAATSAVGRNITLSGRISLWILSVFMALKRPWLGYGYYAFWEGMNGPSSRILVALNIGMPHAHNGFLDLWLNLGLVGLLVFVVGFIIYLRRAFIFLDWRSPDSSWPLAFLAFVFLYNLTESTLLIPNTLFWALYAATAFTVSDEPQKSFAQLPIGGHQVAYGVR